MALELFHHALIDIEVLFKDELNILRAEPFDDADTRAFDVVLLPFFQLMQVKWS